MTAAGCSKFRIGKRKVRGKHIFFREFEEESSTTETCSCHSSKPPLKVSPQLRLVLFVYCLIFRKANHVNVLIVVFLHCGNFDYSSSPLARHGCM